MGRLAVEAAVRIIKKASVPKFTPVPLKLVTK
jgi:ABC-type sugar transport system substrate-binding protein